MNQLNAQLAASGACVARRAVSADEITGAAAEFEIATAGFRGVADALATSALVGEHGALGRLATKLCGRPMRPVRVVRFDKTATTNWMVPWHQDRTIVVAGRHDIEGFGPWSVKRGAVHVEPPVALLEGMLTLRLFIDTCFEDQGPIEIALDTHRLGRVPVEHAAEIAATHPAFVATGEAGDVLAMHPLALHRSARSRSDGRRRTLHVDYATGDLPPPLVWAMT